MITLEYESPATQRRATLWRLAHTVAQVHVGLLTFAMLLGVLSASKTIREVQWHHLNGPERVVMWMGYVGVLQALAWLTSLIALVVLHRIVNGRSGWPLLFLYVVPHLALLATYEIAARLVGKETIPVSTTSGGSTLFVVNSALLRVAFMAMLSAPLLVITYNLIDYLANRPRKKRVPTTGVGRAG